MRTLGQLEDMVRRRLGWSAADTFQSNTELRDMLEQSRGELNNFLVQLHQGNHRVLTMTMAMTAGTQFYQANALLLTGTYIDRLLRVAFIKDGISVPMRRLDWEAGELLETQQAWTRTTDVRYRFVRRFLEQTESASAELWFYPIPDSAYVVRLHYVAALGSFSLTTALNTLGHDEYLVLDTMIKCIQAEEGDASVVIGQKQRYIEMVTQNETPIDLGQAQTIVDQRDADPLYRGGTWP